MVTFPSSMVRAREQAPRDRAHGVDFHLLEHLRLGSLFEPADLSLLKCVTWNLICRDEAKS